MAGALLVGGTVRGAVGGAFGCCGGASGQDGGGPEADDDDAAPKPDSSSGPEELRILSKMTAVSATISRNFK
jgi:hypothetical protein